MSHGLQNLLSPTDDEAPPLPSSPSPSGRNPSSSSSPEVLDVSLLFRYRNNSLQSSSAPSASGSTSSFTPRASAKYLYNRRGIYSNATLSDLQEGTAAASVEEVAAPSSSRSSNKSSSSSSSSSKVAGAALVTDDRVTCVVNFPSIQSRNSLLSFFSDELHSFLMFLRICFLYNQFDVALVWAVSAGSTCFFYYYSPKDSVNERLAFNENWTMLSIALIFPLTMTLTETFRRRESALQSLTNLKVNILSIFISHCDWDFYTVPKFEPSRPAVSGRYDVSSPESARLSPGHCSELLVVLNRFIDMSYSILSAPRVSHAIHFYTSSGEAHRLEVARITSLLDQSVLCLYHEISLFGEQFKEAGLPVAEHSRLVAFENALFLAYTNLRTIKDYRSPIGLRAFARVFIIITPLVFGPYYSLVARETSLSWSICLSCLTSSGMLGLYNLRHALEDPFTPLGAGRGSVDEKSSPFTRLLAHYGDTIDLEHELSRLRQDLRLVLEKRSTEDIHRFFERP